MKCRGCGWPIEGDAYYGPPGPMHVMCELSRLDGLIVEQTHFLEDVYKLFEQCADGWTGDARCLEDPDVKKLCVLCTIRERYQILEEEKRKAGTA